LCVCVPYLSQNNPPLFFRTELTPVTKSNQFMFVMDTSFLSLVFNLNDLHASKGQCEL